MNADQTRLFAERRSPGAEIQADLEGALALFATPKIGSARYRALLSAFGAPQRIFAASESALREVPGVDAVIAASIRQTALQDDGAQLLHSLQKCNARVVSIWDAEYPPLLKEIHDPPVLLFVRGELPSAKQPCCAIVGTRNASIYGIRQALRIAEDLAAQGVGVVSGMARGIDTAAHEGCLQGKGKTYAVFGCGIDSIYPPENVSLAQKIENHGGLISEFLPDTPPDPGLFPRRNRIISGLCWGVLVVQGSQSSGALITARYALEQNRQVFALPGNVEEIRSKGPHELLRQGATLVESAEDILREIGAIYEKEMSAPLPLPPLNVSEAAVVSKLTADPIHIDQLVRELEQPVAAVLADLLGLEMKGYVIQMPGKQFALKR